MSEDVVQLNNLIVNAFKNINCSEMQEANNVENSWKKILLSIKGVNQYEGQNLYDHSKIVDLKNGILLIETDHPGWIQMLQLRKKYILTGLKKFNPDLKIDSLAFRLKGNKGELSGIDEDKSIEKTKEKIKERIEMEEKALQQEKNEENLKESKPLPPELQSIFDDLKKSMLTNSENKW